MVCLNIVLILICLILHCHSLEVSEVTESLLLSHRFSISSFQCFLFLPIIEFLQITSQKNNDKVIIINSLFYFYLFFLLNITTEILAPVGGPVQKLFLSIQHQRNDETRDLILSGGIDLSKNSESGYGPVHIACKYNNRFALDLLLQRGVHIESLDTSGNSTLHYAAKAGTIDICKMLVENGCSAARRNSQHQTPYDVSQNHIIRQYLLPIQLKLEANEMPAQLGISTDASYSSQSYQQHMSQAVHYAPPPMYGAPPIGAGLSIDQLASGHISAPVTPYHQHMQTIDLNTPAGQPLSFQQQPLPPSTMYSPAASSSSRVILPDGFHTSASDPALQQKYGHVKQLGVVQQNGNVVSVPPPTAITSHPTYCAYQDPNLYQTGAPPPLQNVYSRYVAVDFNNNAIPPPAYAPPPATPYVPPVPTVFTLPQHQQQLPQQFEPQQVQPQGLSRGLAGGLAPPARFGPPGVRPNV